MTLVPPLTRARPLRTVRPASGALILAVVVLHSALTSLFFAPDFQMFVSRPMTAATAGVATHVLVTNALEFAVLIAGCMVVVGGLRLGDLGLHRRGIAVAVLTTLVLWGLTQLVMHALSVITNTPAILNPIWMYPMASEAIGRPLPGLFIAAGVEEVMYRGFLLPQLYYHARGWGLRGSGRRLIAALCISQVLFGVNHIPAGIAAELSIGEIVSYVTMAALVGVFFSVLYLRTANLWLIIGLHAVLNQPLSFYLSPLDPSLVVLVLGLLLTLAIPFLRRVLPTSTPSSPSAKPPTG